MNDFTLGERIRHIRKKLHLNQAQFAAALGIRSGTSVSKYEDDQRRPGKNVLQEIARLGNVSLDDLLGHADGPKKQPEGPLEKAVSLPAGGVHFMRRQSDVRVTVTETLEMCRRVLQSGTPHAAVLSLNIRHFYHAALADRPDAFGQTVRTQRQTQGPTFETQQEKETGAHPRFLARRGGTTHKTDK